LCFKGGHLFGLNTALGFLCGPGAGGLFGIGELLDLIQGLSVFGSKCLGFADGFLVRFLQLQGTERGVLQALLE